MLNPIKREKENRRAAGNLFQELYKKALLGRLQRYQSIQEKIPEMKYKLEDPLGFQADREVEKISLYYKEVEGKEVLTKKQILRLLSFRRTLSGIIQNNLGRRIDYAKELIGQIDLFLGKK